MNFSQLRIDPKISKLGSALKKGITFQIKETDVLLYLGASAGTTVSYFSDVLAKGFIFAVEISRRMCMHLVFLARQRNNIAPILADAAQPEQYAKNIVPVDIIYQDVSQRNQVDIFLKNCDMFLKKGGIAILCLKARSIDLRRKPEDIFAEAEKEISKQLKLAQKTTLEPWQKEHMFFVFRKEVKF
ncbi:MAG: fibrillarin-like rRNA/tRNA 2'-O-methyltransferase [Candidatus Aenigmarchaeota archaeon]|nr:fibrillarin-like rRNA/tRNA 2'-O-methyltransferase [Candidatus Aenigmarchaeota archaeon]